MTPDGPPVASSPFHPVVVLPDEVDLLDLTTEAGMALPRTSAFSIGRYNEARIIYVQDLFGGTRNIHMGIDLGGPAGTPVHAFADCELYSLGTNGAQGDYGPTIITVQQLDNRPLWALHGHLSADSLLDKTAGQRFRRGDIIGWLGHEKENGGWPPHVHFQLSWIKPQGHDLPGVVSGAEHVQALLNYPDPRRVLGPLYVDEGTNQNE